MAYQSDEEKYTRPRIAHTHGVWVEDKYIQLQKGIKVQPNGTVYYINWSDRYVDVFFSNQDGSSSIESFEFDQFTDYNTATNSWMIWSFLS